MPGSGAHAAYALGYCEQ